MDYKCFNLDCPPEDAPLLVIKGIYDPFQITIAGNEKTEKLDLNSENFKKICSDFETVMSFLYEKVLKRNIYLTKMKITNRRSLFAKMRDLLLELNRFMPKFNKIIEAELRRNAVIQHLSDYIVIKKDEDEDAFDFEEEEEEANEENEKEKEEIVINQANENEEEEIDDYEMIESQSDQIMLQYGLFILKACAENSVLLCSDIINYGVLIRFQTCFKYYNECSRYIIYSTLAEIFKKKPHIGELGFLQFVFGLAEKYINLKEYNKDSRQTGLVAQILFSLNEYSRFSDDDNVEMKFRRFISEKAFIIFNDELVNCYNSAIKGLSDLVKLDWFYLENKDLINLAFKFYNETHDAYRMSFIVQLLNNLYLHMPPKFHNYFKTITDKQIPNIIDSLQFQNVNNLFTHSLNLCLSILNQYPDFIHYFANEIFFGNLFDSVDKKSYSQKVIGFVFISYLLQIPNQNFVYAFCNSVLCTAYLTALVTIESQSDDFNKLLKGIVCAMNQNEGLVRYVLEKNNVIEDLFDSTSDEEGQALLDDLRNRFSSPDNE